MSQKTSCSPPDLASVAAVLEELLKPGHQLSRTKRWWYVKRWDSRPTPNGPKMTWFDVANGPDLTILLARLREGPREP